jgi:nanoRNase/pAp phosphatase (c-di-AMP/oligoRNAs hydrolase)
LTESKGAKAYSKKISSFLSKSGLLKKKYNSMLVFTHRQADPDALCSAYAISELVIRARRGRRWVRTQARSISGKIVAPQGASLLGASVCKTLSIDFDEEIDNRQIEKADLIVAVDVGDDALLEPYVDAISGSKALKILIDHHSSGSHDDSIPHVGTGLFEYALLESNATSTCEIVANLYPQNLLDERISKILLVGLLFDSQHLSLATDVTLEAALKLVRNGARVDEAKELLRSKPDRAEVIARLKSSQRLKFKEIANYIFAETQVSSFQASVARMLIEIGADVGIAFGEHEGETRISIRTTQRFHRETGIDVGTLLSKISKENQMNGGGHSTAGSISGNDTTSNLKEKIFNEMIKGLPQI